jgi:replicative DNA helicase
MAKSIGMELNCAVILISQLRKEYGVAQNSKQDSRPPSLSRIYGSGAKSKHASIVIFADRKWEENLDGVTKDAVLWVLKNRDGRTGPIPATFNIAKLRFDQAPDPENQSFREEVGRQDTAFEFDFDERGQPWPKKEKSK